MAGRVLTLAGLAWFFALLILPGALYVLGERSDNVENRSLEAFPEWTPSSAFKIVTYRVAADALIDRLPVRDRALSLKGQALIALGDNPNPTAVVVGKGGWLFITDEVLCDAPGTTTAQFLDQLALARSAVLAAGKGFAFTAVPSKMIEEGRHFGSHHPWEGCARARLADLRRETVGKPGVIDLWTPLGAITSSRGDVFWRTDSHMNPRGRLAFVRALESTIEPERARTVRIGLGAPTRHLGDITLLTGFKEFETDRPLVTRTTPETPPPAPRPNVILGDSQTEEIQDQLAAGAISSFRFCHWDKGFWLGACDSALQQAGSITIETVARAIWRRTEPAFGTRILQAMIPVIPSLPATWIGLSGAKPGAGGGATLTEPHARFRLRVPHDAPDKRRLIRFAIDATAVGGQPFIQLLIDGKPATGLMTSIGSAPSGPELVLAVPRGVAIDRTQVAVGSSPGATVGPARVSVLP
jgi:hypothetical protein